MKINIITSNGLDWFSRQFSVEDKAMHEIFVNSEIAEDWDVVVIFENLPQTFKLKCKKGGMIFISGEPPLSSVYPNSFLNQFDCILTSHLNLSHKNVHSQQSLPWMIGLNRKDNSYSLTYNDFLTDDFSKKEMIISTICSFKKMMPGHRQRNTLIKELMNKYGNKIDYYGSGFNFVDDKQTAIIPYKFHLCIENSFIPNYWTEKLSDSILGLAVPIYIGCTNIEDYFDTSCMYVCTLDDTQMIFDIIDTILKKPQQAYEEKIDSLMIARKKLLNEYNIIPTINNLLKYSKINQEVRSIIIKPKNECLWYSALYIWMRFKRIVKRNFTL